MSENDILNLIKDDKWMMDILKTVDNLKLPDWWIGAGFVRSKVWDYLHGYTERTPLPDVDVIYYDKIDYSENEAKSFSTKEENNYQHQLSEKFPDINWSVTNQARMHLTRGRVSYRNSEEALSEWSETATCIGVKLERGKPVLAAPYGIADLVYLVIRPIPGYDNKYKHDPNIFEQRVKDKEWLKKWPKLRLWKDKD